MRLRSRLRGPAADRLARVIVQRHDRCAVNHRDRQDRQGDRQFEHALRGPVAISSATPAIRPNCCRIGSRPVGRSRVPPGGELPSCSRLCVRCGRTRHPARRRAGPFDRRCGKGCSLALVLQAPMEIVHNGGSPGMAGEDRSRGRGDAFGPVAFGPVAQELAAIPVPADAVGQAGHAYPADRAGSGEARRRASARVSSTIRQSSVTTDGLI